MRGGVLVAAGAACISFAPVFVRAIQAPATAGQATQPALGPAGIAAWRTLLGGLVLVAWCGARGLSLRGSRRAVVLALLAGVLLAADFSAWHRSIALVGGGIATILGNTQVVWVALAGTLLLRERGGGRLAIAVAAAVAGVALMAGALERSRADRPDALGVALGCLTGVLYASFLLVLRRAGRDERPLAPAACLACVSVACGLASFSAAAATGEPLLPSDSRTWGLLVALALVAQVLGWLLIATGLPRVPASRAGLLLLLQPTLAAGWGILFFDERFTAWQAAGAALTLGAIYLGSIATGLASRRSP